MIIMLSTPAVCLTVHSLITRITMACVIQAMVLVVKLCNHCYELKSRISPSADNMTMVCGPQFLTQSLSVGWQFGVALWLCFLRYLCLASLHCPGPSHWVTSPVCCHQCPEHPGACCFRCPPVTPPKSTLHPPPFIWSPQVLPSPPSPGGGGQDRCHSASYHSIQPNSLTAPHHPADQRMPLS